MKRPAILVLSAASALCGCGAAVPTPPAASPVAPIAVAEPVAPSVAERCVARDPDGRPDAESIKLLFERRDRRAEACYIEALRAFKPGEKETEHSARWAARAVGAMKLESAAGPLFDVFLALRPSLLRAEPELYRDVHDAMVELLVPAWEAPLIERLNRPMPADRRDYQALRDEVFWQVTAAEILGRLRSTAAVRPLLKAVISPLKVDIASTAVHALIQIGKPSLAPAIALLRSEDKELVAYSLGENLIADTGPDGKVPDAARKAAERKHIGSAAIILAAIGREEAGAALVHALDKLDEGDDLSRAVIARELPKVPTTPAILKAFQVAYDRTPPSLSIPPGSGARESLLENASYFFDASLVPWIVKTALDLKGEADDVDAIRGSSLMTALKLMTPDQAGDVAKLLRMKIRGPDEKPSTLGKEYDRENKITRDLLAACHKQIDCYFGTLVDPASQAQERQFQGIKAAYMIGVLGGPEVRQRLVDALPRISNAALRYVVAQVIDHRSPRGDAGLAAALQKVVDEGLASKDGNRIAGNAALKMVIYRLEARAGAGGDPR